MTASFWNGRRVLLTGHTGFKGSWLSLMLKALGAKVSGFALPPSTTPSLFYETDLPSLIDSRFGDIGDMPALQKVFAEAEPEIVLHLAAQALVSESYANPLETLQTNILGCANILQVAGASASVRVIIVVTSDKCYENAESNAAFRETDPLGGKDPYSCSKACAELVAASWRHSFFDRQDAPVIATARAGNVIGGGDWSPNRLIPDLVRAFADGQPALVRSPDSVRPWQHVLEPLHGYLLLAENCAMDRNFGQAWNFGPDHGDARPVSYVADTLARHWGPGAGWSQPAGNNPVKEAQTLKLDSSKARDLLHWYPLTNLDQGLELTAAWYRAHAAGQNAGKLTAAQIQDFLARS